MIFFSQMTNNPIKHRKPWKPNKTFSSYIIQIADMQHTICIQVEELNKTFFIPYSNNKCHVPHSGLILGLRPANERRRYKVTPSLIGWAQT